MRLTEILKIEKGITALIGGGGKTGCMHTLARELSEQGTVILTTSTHICASEEFSTYTDPEASKIRERLAKEGAICVAGEAPGGKLCAPRLSFAELEKLADYVIVEADGARRLPMKAHASHEPVIPENTKLTILVVGADGFGRTICDVCHRPQLYVEAAGLTNGIVEIARADAGDLSTREAVVTRLTGERVTPELEACVIEKEGFGDLIFVNKCETDERWEYANKLARLVHKPVIAGSLWRGEYRCLQ
ncbi:MAG: selenium cofactor biosynthesis protein YqeC [Acetatifactor sp.]